MKTNIILLRITGIICLLFTGFHLAFPYLFQWDHALACLSPTNRGIMLTYHYISILILSFMTLVLLFQAGTLLESTLKYSVLLLFIAFFVIRIITEFVHFGYRPAGSPVILILCMIPAVFCAIPLFTSSKKNVSK